MIINQYKRLAVGDNYRPLEGQLFQELIKLNIMSEDANDAAEAVESTVIVPNGTELLGCLYNCLSSPYAEKKYVRERVVDGIDNATETSQLEIDQTNGLYYEFPSVLETRAYNSMEGETISSYSYSEYTESMGLRVGIEGEYGAFSGEVTTNLNISESSTDEYCYATILDSKPWAQAGFYKSDLESADSGLSLDSTFKDKLNDANYAPTDLFDDYGTHIISGILIGGQVRYTTYASKSTYSSSEEFEVNAKAKYIGLTGSTNVDVDYSNVSDSYQEDVASGSTLLVYGGSESTHDNVGACDESADETLEGNYSAWFEDVDTNPDFMEFTPDGLIPVWELCDDDDRRDAIEAAFKGFNVTNLYVDNKKCVYENGSSVDSSDYKDLDNDLKAWAEDQPVTQYWVAYKDYQVITGFAITVSSKTNHIARIMVRVLNLQTGESTYEFDGNGTADSSYEAKLVDEVPEGSVVTGIGLREKNGNVTNISLLIQEIDLENPGNGYLSDNSEKIYDGGALSEYEVQYFPDDPNNMVVTGIAATCSSGANGFVRLALEVGELKVKID